MSAETPFCRSLGVFLRAVPSRSRGAYLCQMEICAQSRLGTRYSPFIVSLASAYHRVSVVLLPIDFRRRQAFWLPRGRPPGRWLLRILLRQLHRAERTRETLYAFLLERFNLPSKPPKSKRHYSFVPPLRRIKRGHQNRRSSNSNWLRLDGEAGV